MKFRQILVLLLILCGSSRALAQALWTDSVSTAAAQYLQVAKNSMPAQYRTITLQSSALQSLQALAPKETAASPTIAGAPGFVIPLPDGGNLNASIAESPILSPQLALLVPGTRTYRLNDAETHQFIGRVTITEEGISGLIFTKKGAVYLTPLGKAWPGQHMAYYIKDVKNVLPVSCGIREQSSGIQPLSPMAGDCQLRTYRLAVAATGEYTTWAGSQANALSYITITVNDVTAIYERELAIRFTLVTNNSVIFPDAATDPYPTLSFPSASGILNTNQTTVDGAIGTANYDVGIVFNDGWNGGLAYSPSACNPANKAGAAAGLDFGTGPNPTAGPQGPIFDQTVAHEIAHQFSATHSFAATNGGCAGNTNAATAWEPGGGSTIMAYAGVCSNNYYQFYSDLYFHAGNLAQIGNYVSGGSGSCATVAASGNNAPVVTTANSAYTIPVSTPFTLSSTGTDADGNTLYYTWEQMDAGASGSPPSATATSGPNFRSFPPSTSPNRTFPVLDSIIAGISPTYEVLPSVGRTLNFRVTARDLAVGAGCTGEANVSVTTDGGTGPFTVTSQNTASSWTANGSNTATITWNVANTNNAPVSCATVDILFSIDGGYTYPYTLVSNTANDGTENIVIPNLPTYAGRIKVQAHDNIFFNINTAAITITSACSAEGSTIAPTLAYSAQAGDPSLDLSLAPNYGSPISITGTVASTDPSGYLAVNNQSPGVCQDIPFQYTYKQFTFTPSVAGTYTFARSGSTNFNLIYNLYQGANSYQPASPCANFLNSSGTYDGVSTVNVANSFTQTLYPGLYYTLTIGTFNTGSPPLPSAFTINVTAPPGGGLFDYIPSPGGSFNYTFIIVDNATGNIVAIDPLTDLTNSGTFPGGTTYTIYGLSYNNSISLATLNGYIGGSFSTLQNDVLYNPAALCSNLSKNQVQVAILAATPVSFLGLSARVTNQTVQLNWKTASEQHNAYFEVQRSTDGILFTDVLGKVPGAGNSSDIRQYFFTDDMPAGGMNFYRIRQVDLDGHFSYSNIASARIDRSGDILRLYPNPASDRLFLDYEAVAAGKSSIEIIDGKGAVLSRMTSSLQPGRNRIAVDLKGWRAGIYVVKIVAAGNTSIRRFVKQ